MAARRQLTLTNAEVAGVLALMKRTGNFRPEAEVVESFQVGELTSGMVTFFLPSMWLNRRDESPVPAEVWRAMFECAAYTEDTIVRRRSRRSSLAYRGATEANREGLSWSLDVQQARDFARSRQAPGIAGSIWVTRIPGDRVFARFIEGWEKELTADVRGLEIYPLEDASRLVRPWWRIGLSRTAARA